MLYAFCEHRTRPITSKETTEYLQRTQESFCGSASNGEIYSFQLCVGSDAVLPKVSLGFDPLVAADGNYTIDANRITCYNLEGNDSQGIPFKKTLDVKGHQVLWLGINIPMEAPKGQYTSSIGILSEGECISKVDLTLNIQGEPILDHGYSEGWRLARLHWLNSTRGLDDSIPQGYTPVETDGLSVKLLGRQVRLNDSGMIEAIHSHFEEDLRTVGDSYTDVICDAIHFEAMLEGNPLEFKVINPSACTASSGQSVTFTTKESNEHLEMVHALTIAYDGYMKQTTTVTAKEACSLDGLRYRASFSEEASKYAMGFGHAGGFLKPFTYRWNNHHQDALWVGCPHAGLYCTFKDEDYVPPFVNVYYNQQKRKKPLWDNDGKGTVRLTKDNNGATLTLSTGSLDLKEGESKTYVIEYMVTPLHCIDYKKHWQTRYYHPGGKEPKQWIDDMVQDDYNYINIHHGQDLHPFINYPFVEIKAMKAFIKEAHEQGKKVKLYYTLRELTDHTAEMWAFYSLGDEIFPKRTKAPILSWQLSPSRVKKYIDRRLIPAWQHVFKKGKYQGEACSSILVNPDSRLVNFYIEGLAWLINELDIDGLYIDDTALDRKAMQRMRKVLDTKPNMLVDLHSWNHLCYRAGRISSALLYCTLLPYVDRLWFGEGFDYNMPPDYWLVEVSGIPFGLTGEMLQSDGHPFRGMVYGMSNRAQWGKRSPRPIQKLWDDFGIEDSHMMGYWLADCPVKINDPSYKATAYVKDDAVLIAIGSWCKKTKPITLDVDWEQLGLNKDKVSVTLPYVEGLQEAQTLDGCTLTVEANQGALVMIKTA